MPKKKLTTSNGNSPKKRSSKGTTAEEAETVRKFSDEIMGIYRALAGSSWLDDCDYPVYSCVRIDSLEGINEDDISEADRQFLLPAISMLGKFRTIENGVNFSDWGPLEPELRIDAVATLRFLSEQLFVEEADVCAILVNDQISLDDRKWIAISRLKRACRKLSQFHGYRLVHLATRLSEYAKSIGPSQMSPQDNILLRPGSARDHQRSDFAHPYKTKIPPDRWKEIAAAYSEEFPNDACGEGGMKQSWYEAGGARWYQRRQNL